MLESMKKSVGDLSSEGSGVGKSREFFKRTHRIKNKTK